MGTVADKETSMWRENQSVTMDGKTPLEKGVPMWCAGIFNMLALCTLLSGCLDTEVAFLQKTPILELLLPILAWMMCHATGEKQISGIVGTARHTIVREEKRRG